MGVPNIPTERETEIPRLEKIKQVSDLRDCRDDESGRLRDNGNGLKSALGAPFRRVYAHADAA